jgi:hypothetical protein
VVSDATTSAEIGQCLKNVHHHRSLNSAKDDSESFRLLPVIFFERCKAHDLLEHFKQSFAGIPFDKMIQVSMDGPNVNWSFLSKLEQELVIELTQENLETLGRFELGLCGLHVGHRAFRSGHDAVDWKVQQALTCGYWLFKESTLRKAEYKDITNSTCLPKKICSSRWVENVEPAKTLLAISPHLEKYLKEAKQSKKESLHSWKTLVDFFKDPFYKAKLEFFISFGQEIEPFLRKFQSPNPMAPLLFEELLQILTQLLRHVLKTTFFDQFVGRP